jgi:hypothetical protein
MFLKWEPTKSYIIEFTYNWFSKLTLQVENLKSMQFDVIQKTVLKLTMDTDTEVTILKTILVTGRL